MFYYRDKQSLLIKSLKELTSENLTPLTEEEYNAAIAALTEEDGNVLSE